MTMPKNLQLPWLCGQNIPLLSTITKPTGQGSPPPLNRQCPFKKNSVDAFPNPYLFPQHVRGRSPWGGNTQQASQDIPLHLPACKIFQMSFTVYVDILDILYGVNDQYFDTLLDKLFFKGFWSHRYWRHCQKYSHHKADNVLLTTLQAEPPSCHLDKYIEYVKYLCLHLHPVCRHPVVIEWAAANDCFQSANIFALILNVQPHSETLSKFDLPKVRCFMLHPHPTQSSLTMSFVRFELELGLRAVYPTQRFP